MKIRTLFVTLLCLLALAGFVCSMVWFPWVSVIPAAIFVWTGYILWKRRKPFKMAINWLLVAKVISVILMILFAIATVAIAILFGWWALLAAAAFLGALIWFLVLIGKMVISPAAVVGSALVMVLVLFGIFCMFKYIGVLNVGQLNVGEINATEVNATKVNATEVNATKVNATKVNATEVNATKVNATEVNATKVNATEVNATKVNVTNGDVTKKQTTDSTTKPTTESTKRPTTESTKKPTTESTKKPTSTTTKPTTVIKNPSISVSTDYMQKGDTVIVTLKDATASDVVIKYVNPNNGSWVYGGATLKSIGNNQYRLVVDDSLFEMAVDLTLGLSGQSNYKIVTLEPCYE